MFIRVFLHAEFIFAMELIQIQMKNAKELEIFKFLRKANKAKLEIFISKAIAYDKIGGNYDLSAISTKICVLGYFCMLNSYLR